MPIKWCNPENLNRIAKGEIYPAKIVLDIGCGIKPQRIFTPQVHICCDPYKPYLTYLRDKVINKDKKRNYILLHSNWANILNLFLEKSVDTVFLLDVIEHLEKGGVKTLLKKTEKVVKNQIVIFTPLGYLSQKHPNGIDAWGMKGGKFQEHKSGWYPEDFDASWNIYACKDYIKTDNLGKKLKQPQGAFWAIKNFKNYNQNEPFLKSFFYRYFSWCKKP